MAKTKADLDLYKLEIFYWVAELKSFSQAAELLSLRQPTISAHVQELERAVGGKLFYRISGKVSFTPLGQMLAERAKNLLVFKRETVAAVEQFHGTLSGELWVGGSSIPGEYLLPPKLGAFTKKYPGVKPILRIGDSARIVEELLDGKVEIGFVGFKGDDSRLSFEKIWDDEMVLAVPKGHPWSRRKECRSEICAPKIHLTRARLGHAGFHPAAPGAAPASRGRSIEHHHGTRQHRGGERSLDGGIRVLHLVTHLDPPRSERGDIVEVPIRGLTMKRDFYAMFHKRRPLHPIAQAFRDFLKE